MKELFTLYYHRRILFTDFFSQSQITSDSSALYFMVMDIMSIALYAIAILLIPNIYDP